MSVADLLEDALINVKDSKAEQGRVIIFSKEEVREMGRNIHNMLYGQRGAFSGTNTCVCGGEVIYSVKRNDGSELGACRKCGQVYTNPNGHRLPSF